MKAIYRRAVLFWFVLLALAVANALVRELTYKPVLEPKIGMWAHQISSLTAILLFFAATYVFMKRNGHDSKGREPAVIGLVWAAMTVIFEVSMSLYARGLTWTQIMETYYFWKGETWIFVLIALAFSPWIAKRIIERNKQ